MAKLNSEILVSVVIPTYNHEYYIEQALNSVYEQTYPAIELIILDDCSQDYTLQRVQQWANHRQAQQRFARLIIDRNVRNVGAYQTINRGLGLAQGKWLTILNSDDYYAVNRIEVLLQQASQHQADWLFSKVNVINGFDKALFSELAIELEASFDYAYLYPTISFALLRKNIAITTGNLFFSRELYQKFMIKAVSPLLAPFRNLRYCHDWDFALQACLISEPIFVEMSLYYYRVHTNNAFSKLKLEQYLETQIVYWHYFSACRSGYCQNILAPSVDNWPDFFQQWANDDNVLQGALFLVGHHPIKYDRLAQSINHAIN